jgi:hypothetical protein
MAKNVVAEAPVRYQSKSKQDVQKELIIKALTNCAVTADDEFYRLAKCIEAGKVSINGCTNTNTVVDEVLVDIAHRSKDMASMDGLEIRDLLDILNRVVKTGERCKRGHSRVSNRFYQELHALKVEARVD